MACISLSVDEMGFRPSSWQGIQKSCEKYPQIHLAAMKGQNRVLRKLINEESDIDTTINTGSRAGCTALHIAAENEKSESVKILLSSGANSCLQNENGSTPLHVAFENKSTTSTLLILLNLNIHSDIVNNKGVSHFHIACTTDEVTIVEKFLLNGAELNQQITSYSKYRGDTPLHFACRSGSAKTVRYLLENGADFTLKNASNETPLHLALKMYHNKAVQLILKAFFAVCSKINENIEKEFSRNKIPMDIRIKPSQSFMETFRPLHFAGKFQLLDIIKILIANGIDVQAKDSNGMTALHCAVQDTQTGLLEEDYLDVSLPVNWEEGTEFDPYPGRLVNIVDELLNAGCDVNALDNFHRTPIFYLYDRLSQRAELKSACSHAKRPTSDGPLSFYGSVSHVRRRIIRRLCAASPVLDVQDLEGDTILHLLAKAGTGFLCSFEAEVPEEYLRRGGDVNALNRAGYTALHYACGNGHASLVDVLLRNGADVNLTRSEMLERPIHRAARYLRGTSQHCRGRCTRKYELVEQLLKRGAHVDATMANGTTPILIATNSLASSAGPSMNNLLIMCLLNWGCNLNCADSVGRTPLHYVCKHKNLPMLELFLKRGADINALDHHGNTPFSIVRKSNRFSLVDSLILFSYVKRLMILGLPLSFANRKLYALHDNVVSLCDTVREKLREILTDEQCENQLEYMKTVHVDSYTTLYDILRRSTSSLVHHVNNERLLSIFWDDHFDEDYSIYGYLAKIKMDSARKRAVLLEPAKESLLSVVQFDMPDACVYGILSHLRNVDLKSLIEANVTKEKIIDEIEDESTLDAKRPRLS